MAVPPELRARVGTPETLTGSLVTTVTVTFVPDLIAPPPEAIPLPENVTEVIDGALVSTTKIPVGLLLKVERAFPAVSDTVPENETTSKSRAA